VARGVRQTVAVDDQLAAGLYEVIVTEALAGRLMNVDERLVHRPSIRAADAADRVAQLLARQITRVLDAVPESDRVATGVALARRLLEELDSMVPRGNSRSEMPVTAGEVLNAIGERLPDGSVRMAARPLIPLLDTTLLTNSPGEPRVGRQIGTEIESADSIDVVMAFVRTSGLAPIITALRQHTAGGRKLRVLTTTYTGSTEAKALDQLVDAGADVRVSYDLTTARLHAKAWLFHRRTAFSTAYVGSSNLTHSAQGPGIEWNVRVSAARNPDVVEKIGAVFETYWQSTDFVPYREAEFRKAVARSRQPDPGVISPIEIELKPFQDRMVELIEVSREQGYHRNLLVSATGTGKTVMAAMDYRRLRSKLPRARLLFVAHRQEILDQSLATFRHVLGDYTFGEKWAGGARPTSFDHVFASVQSLSAQSWEHLAPDHFDVIIVDEFHHAAAPSYRRIMEDLKPRELLGLTATPERTDNLPLLHWFGDRIAAELRLWDAIEQHRLAPFAYYGIHDGTDLRDVPWRRGHGYDSSALAAVYMREDDSWAHHVLRQLEMRVDDVARIRCLGFCVTVEHARYMAARFRDLGLSAVAVWGETPTAERAEALRQLRDGKVQVVFSVDIFNEGVDVPSVDTILMLRPTDSAILFLQQLGRGLRITKDKTLCTVLDFVGLHRKEFRFDKRYRALLGSTRRDLERAIQDGFPFLPAGCHVELDRVAQDIVLKNIRASLPSRWPAKVDELRSMYRAHGDVSMRRFLRDTGLEVADLYAGNRGWSALREAAGLPVEPSGPNEEALRRGISRLLHVDDPQRLEWYLAMLDPSVRPTVEQMSEVERRLSRMLVSHLADQVLDRAAPLQAAIDVVWQHPQIKVELGELFHVLRDNLSHLQQAALPGVPLQIHSQYSRIEILAAVGEGNAAKTPQWREGVYDAKSASADLLAFTLDKTSGDFSPTTRYRDYAISRDVIHWESQSTTSAGSPTGQRYQHHAQMGRSILLFARARADDRAFWFLGPAKYVEHEGERPMAVTWKLATPLSGDLFAAFAAAVA
jgi:superfamily II DNA or RNA helicase